MTYKAMRGLLYFRKVHNLHFHKFDREYTYTTTGFPFVWYDYLVPMKSGNWLLWLLLLSVIIACSAGAYKYLIVEDYSFIVEASCDSVTQSCYQRDCSNPDDCPPNGLSVYRVFELPSSEFKNCSDNSCANICPSELYQCTEIACDTQDDVECVGPSRL